MIKEAEERNFPEDYSHENGNYRNICCLCKNEFKGHKRRVICKKCEQPEKKK